MIPAVRTDTVRAAWSIIIGLAVGTPLAAQCPDGSPPPCRTRAVAAAPAANSVAVLYFESRSTDTNDLALADGLTEEIISRLSGIERLTVRSRHLVRRYRGTTVDDPAAVGRALGVSYLVTGSIRRSGGRLRVSAELVRAAGGVQVWGRQFDQAGDDVFAIQEAVANQVATGIVGRLLPAESRALAVRPTENAAAYAAVLRGNLYVARRDSAGLARGIREYEAALDADPGYTDALSRVAMAYGIARANGLDLGSPADTLAARAMRAAMEAVRRAPNSSDAWLAMGLARLAAEPRSLSGVREDFERAIAVDPTNAEPHHLLGFVFALMGEDSTGLAHDRMALAIEPSRPVTLMHFAQHALKFGRFAEARRWVDSALVVDPTFYLARAALVVVMTAAGDSANAREEVTRWRDHRQLAGVAALAQGALAVPGSDPAAARQRLSALRASVPPSLGVGLAGYVALTVMTSTGDPGTVLQLFESARPRGAFLRYFMSMVPFDPIRDDARFARLYRELEP